MHRPPSEGGPLSGPGVRAQNVQAFIMYCPSQSRFFVPLRIIVSTSCRNDGAKVASGQAKNQGKKGAIQPLVELKQKHRLMSEENTG